MTTQWRWADAEQSIATDGEGSFAPAGAAELQIFVAEGGSILPFQRWPSAAAAAADLIGTLEQLAEQQRVAVAGTASGSKLAVYREKLLVAETYLADAEDAAATHPLALAALDAEAQARGQSTAALALLVQTLGHGWRAAGLAIDAAYQTHKAAIFALRDADNLVALEAYDLSQGWPGA